MIKNLGRKAREMMLTLYNKCWEGDQLPQEWRTSIIKPLLKSGKNPGETKSYRPIALTSCMGKILKKIITARIVHLLEGGRLIIDDQAGYRKGRSTVDQILRLTQDATDGIQSKDNLTTVVTFFDMENAFDKTWRRGLLLKMIRMGMPGAYVNYVRNFLANRKIQVEIGGTRSRQEFLSQGIPQGSAISPILFLIYINDIGERKEENTRMNIFADDTAMWIRGRSVEEIQQKMQRKVNNIEKWAKEWKMKINIGKRKTEK